MTAKGDNNLGGSPPIAIAGTDAGSETLAEMLDHQGIVYERADPDNRKSYPLLLTPGDSEEGRATDPLLARGGASIPVGSFIELERVHSLLSGTQEYATDAFDAFVNEQEERLVGKIKDVLAERGIALVQKWYWPAFAKAGCVLTHDLDWLVYSPYHKVVLRGPSALVRAPKLLYKQLVSKPKFGWNVPETISIESSVGFRSTFFIKTKYEKAEQELLGETLRLLKGSDVCLHASRSSYRKEESLKEEIGEFRRMVERDPTGVRQHILKFEVPKTWQIQASCGMEFDATFSLNEYFGFRAGVCLPYRPFVGRERLPITELPTSFMDWTFLHRRYGKKKAQQALERVMNTVERHHGLLVVNFHNTYLDRNLFPDVWDTYAHLLRRLKDENYWVATASECHSWWSRRGRAQPEVGGEGVRAVSLSGIPLVVHEEGAAMRIQGVEAH